MKEIALSLTMLGFYTIGHAQFVLNGKITGDGPARLYLLYSNSKGAYLTDSCVVRNGAFRFSGNISEGTMSTLTTSLQNRMDQSRFATIMLEPTTMNAVIPQGDMQNISVTGSAFHTQYAAYNKRIRKIRDRWKVVMDTLSAVNKRSNFEYQEMKNWVLKPYNAEIDEIQSDILLKHPTSYMAAHILSVKGGELSADSLRKFYDRFPGKVQQSSFGKMIAQELEKKKLGAPGIVAPDFAKADIGGEQLKLSDFKGKYVLLDFWASWCVPCRKGNPHLKEIYAHYKSKGLEIIGVSDDDRNPDAWKKAVTDDGITIWKHVLRGLDMEKRMRNEKNPNDLGEAYGIRTLPTKILIDPKGVIIGRYTEGAKGDAALDEKLAEVMR